MAVEQLSFKAGAAIGTSLFVKLSTAADWTVLVGGLNDKPIGVTTEAQLNAPIPGASANAAVAAGDVILVYPPGSVCLLLLGTGGCTRGDDLSCDANGAGVTVASATTAVWVGAVALESASAGELARVLVVRYPWTGT